MKITYEAWKEGDFVIAINGKPIGNTLSKRDAVNMAYWLRSAMPKILSIAKRAHGRIKNKGYSSGKAQENIL